MARAPLWALLAAGVMAAPLLVAPAAVAFGADQGATPTAGLAPNAVVPLFNPLSYEDVALLGNNNSVVSVNLTRHFQQVHAIAEDHVFLADLPASETMTATAFSSFAAWFNGEMANRSIANAVNYIVTFKGVPIRIAWPGPNGPSSFQDALMLLGGTHESWIGSANLWPNPYFNRSERFSFAQFGVRLVTGIYAYNESTAMALIDRAASALGSRGEFVLDADSSKGFAGGHGTYGYANAALVWANASLTAGGHPVYLDTNTTYVTGRSGVIGYSSWGSNDCCWGAVTQNAKPHNTWVNGSIAETFVSTGGRTFTWPPSYGQSLIADWIDEGANAVKGYTDEPYINAIADGHILYGRYAQGYNMAESFWSASHFVGWRQIVVGDPKMAAFYQPDRDLAVNATLTSAPSWAVQGDMANVSVGVDNVGMAQEQVDARLTVAGVTLFAGTLAVPPFAAARYDLALDLSGLDTGTWGPQVVSVVLDPQDLVAETREANNALNVSVEVRRAPVATALLAPPVLYTFEPFNLTLAASRADRPIDHFEIEIDNATNRSVVAVAASNGTALYTGSFARSGNWTFRAWAVDSAGIRSKAAASANLTLLNRAPVAVGTAQDLSPLTLVDVSFAALDSFDPDGSIAAYAWDAGTAGNGSGPSFVLQFARPGNYTVALTVTDDEGATASLTIGLIVRNRPPTAVASANVTSAMTWTPVLVSGRGSLDPDGQVVSYTFLFDDGAVVTQPGPDATHTYLLPGVGGFWVEVTDDWGATHRARFLVDVLNRPPAVVWDGNGSFEALDTWATPFNASATDIDGNLTSYTADFGDGRRAVGMLSAPSATLALTHDYLGAGTYTLTLTVVDEWGSATTVSASVVVLHPPPRTLAFELAVDGRNVSVRFSLDAIVDQLTLTARVDGRAVRSFEVGRTGDLDFSLPATTASGNHTLVIEVDDGTGPVVLGQRAFEVAQPPPPPPPPPPPAINEGARFPVEAVAAIAAAGAALAAVFYLRRRTR